MSPSALSDPPAYLSGAKFNRRITCPRTHLPVSFSDTGDPQGVPLLWILPSGCSRWFAAPQDPLANLFGVRLIAVDRPGVGATPVVPLEDRIRISCCELPRPCSPELTAVLIASVLEHLEVKLAHLLATSAGIYYALRLLTHQPHIFLTGLAPPPRVYLIAPWSPLLPSDHPDYYNSIFPWIPEKLITTQHMTVGLPALLKVSRGAASWWNTGVTTAWNGFEYAKSLLPGALAPAHEIPVPDGSTGVIVPELPVSRKSSSEPQVDEESEEDLRARGRMWGKCPCCIGCVSGRTTRLTVRLTRQLTTDYFHAENFEGVGQEHLLCLNRGSSDTGPEWFVKAVADLAGAIVAAQGAGSETPRTKPAAEKAQSPDSSAVRCPLDIQLWWGWKDGMVPRKGQLWFNKVIGAHPGAIRVTVHDVPDGDHTNLLGRADGIYRVYDMVQETGQHTGPLEPSGTERADVKSSAG
ncbi:hypothetical protein JCM24511_08670 [Saitozyma sp. JCM 24511]|nr:hypothetical protein JCM24511_08670 [Saitozyma sp. JCM 24511]